MSYKEEHVKLRDGDVEGHDDSMKKHLTMKYNLKELRKFTDFEMWVGESLEELVPDERKRPHIEATDMAKLKDEKIIRQLQKMLKAAVRDEEARDHFIEEFVTRLRKLPANLLENM